MIQCRVRAQSGLMPNILKVPSACRVVWECSSKASLSSIYRIKITSSGEGAKSGALEVAEKEDREEEEEGGGGEKEKEEDPVASISARSRCPRRRASSMTRRAKMVPKWCQARGRLLRGLNSENQVWKAMRAGTAARKTHPGKSRGRAKTQSSAWAGHPGADRHLGPEESRLEAVRYLPLWYQ